MSPTALFFMAKPPTAVRAAMQEALAAHALGRRLGAGLFPPEHWHQSLSNLFDDTPDLRMRLMHVGEQLRATAFSMAFNRVGGNAGQAGRIHWSFLARGMPDGFVELLAAIRAGIAAQGMRVGSSHTPHVTISYRAPEPLAPIKIAPIPWQVDQFQLVERGGEPFGYREIARWSLHPAEAAAGFQLGLL